MPDGLRTFLEANRTRCASVFPLPPCDKVFTYLGTTAAEGTLIDLSIHEVVKVQSGGAGQGRVTLRGVLPRLPGRGECITVALLAHTRFRGYQFKSADLIVASQTQSLVEVRPGEFTVNARGVLSIHHGPNTLKMFDEIPMSEVLADLEGVRWAIVGVGVKANVAPRFVFAFETAGEQVSLFHGEGYPHKTFQNLERNKRERRLVLDPATYQGYELTGELQELEPTAPGTSAESVRQAFTKGGWGAPRRIYCLATRDWRPVGP